MAHGARPPATAAEEPPDEPPGMRLRSHGLRVGRKPEFSVDEPIANSSMLVLPSSTVPAALSRAATVASYGGRQPSRIFDPLVVGTPSVTTTFLRATGTPVSRPRSAPVARAPSDSSAAR